MNISNSSIIPAGDNPYAIRGRERPPAERHERARSFADEAEKQRQSAPQAEEPVIIDVKGDAVKAVVPVGEVYSSTRNAEYYQTQDYSKFTASQQKALQLYATNQNLSRLDANADYLGSVDTFA